MLPEVSRRARVLLPCHAARWRRPRRRTTHVFRYRGADRDARLVERAKRKGSVVLYTSLAPTESMPLAEAFEKKYGVKVELWRALSEQVVQRVVTEAQGRRHAVDVIETNGPEMEMLAREKLLGEFHSPYLADLPAERDPGAPLVVSRPDELLRRRLQHDQGAALRDPRPPTRASSTRSGRGASALEATDAEWMATLIKTWGDGKGMDYFRKLSAHEA